MSVLLIVLFASLGAFAMLATASSLVGCLRVAGRLRPALLQSPETIELRFRVENQGLVPELSRRRRKHHLRRGKTGAHRPPRRGVHRASA